jgi:hypothetical protein
MAGVHRFMIGVFAVEVGLGVFVGEVATTFKGDGFFTFCASMRAIIAAFFARGSAIAFVARLLLRLHFGALLSQDRLA